MRAKITKRVVDEARAAEAPAFIFDTELSGFVLKVTPAGKRVFQYRYRMGGRGSTLRTFTIGTYPPMTPDQARRQCQSLVGDVRRGIDPAAEKTKRAAEENSAATLEAVAADFMELHTRAKRKPNTVLAYDDMLRHHILPTFGKRRMKDIAPGHVERWHHGMKATPYAANRALAVLSKLMSWGASRGYCDGPNPCRAVEKFKETPRKRYLSHAEIVAIGEAIRGAETAGTICPFTAALFRMAMLSGLRRDELRLLTWKRVDFDRRVIVLEEDDSKGGARDVPLSGPVLQILTDLPRVEGNPYVFPGRRIGRSLVNVSKPWRRILASAGVSNARFHDLRHTVASVGVATGASLVLIGGILGHKSQQTTSRYAHLSDTPVRAASEEMAARINQALGGQETAAVVPLRRAK